MNQRIIKIIVLAAVIGLFVYFGISLVSKGETSSVIGQKAYDFELEDMNGKKVKLSDYKGQVVILNYFATWCGPCVDEAPVLEEFEQAYGDQFKLLIIDLGETQDRVKKFIKKHNTTSTYLFDFNKKVSKEYNVVGQPETFFIDKDGIVREQYNGPFSSKEQLYELASKYQ